MLILSRRMIIKLLDDKKIEDPLNEDVVTWILKGVHIFLISNIAYLTYRMITEYSISSSLFLVY